MAKNGNYKVLIWRNGRRRVSGFGIFVVSYSWKGAGIALNIFLSLGSFATPPANTHVCKSLVVYTQGLQMEEEEHHYHFVKRCRRF